MERLQFLILVSLVNKYVLFYFDFWFCYWVNLASQKKIFWKIFQFFCTSSLDYTSADSSSISSEFPFKSKIFHFWIRCGFFMQSSAVWSWESAISRQPNPQAWTFIRMILINYKKNTIKDNVCWISLNESFSNLKGNK